MRIDVEGLSFGYGGTPVLHDINLSIDRPGLYCIIGPNGVGKSTLVKCIMKILEPTSGSIRIDGRDIRDISLKELSRVASFIPASGSDVFSMTVMDTVLMGLSGNRRWRFSEADIKRAYNTLRLLGIDDLAMRDSKELSAGQHQKVAIARGLVQDTELVILDEPTSNLDIRHQVYVTEMLKALAARTSKIVLMISHDLNIAARYADQIIVLHEPGEVYAIGTPGEVIDERMLKEVYGIDGEVIRYAGRPHMLINCAIPGDDGRI